MSEINIAKQEAITREEVMAVLNYNAETGVWTWKLSKSLRVKPGDVAGTVTNKGYRQIMLNYRWYRANRLAWFVTYGVWPGILDHINGQRDDNRIENLRPATTQQNNRNVALRRDSTTGCPGVSFSRRHRAYQARLYIDNSSRALGLFKSREDACASAAAARAEAFGAFARRAAA